MTIKTFNLGWNVILLRYFLMMFVVIVGVLTHTWALAFLGFPLFLLAILGVSFQWKKEQGSNAKMVTLGDMDRKDRKVS
jgi:hypothetical protein